DYFRTAQPKGWAKPHGEWNTVFQPRLAVERQHHHKDYRSQQHNQQGLHEIELPQRGQKRLTDNENLNYRQGRPPQQYIGKGPKGATDSWGRLNAVGAARG